jgi:hypothetical protein
MVACAHAASTVYLHRFMHLVNCLCMLLCNTFARELLEVTRVLLFGLCGEVVARLVVALIPPKLDPGRPPCHPRLPALWAQCTHSPPVTLLWYAAHGANGCLLSPGALIGPLGTQQGGLQAARAVPCEDAPVYAWGVLHLMGS